MATYDGTLNILSPRVESIEHGDEIEKWQLEEHGWTIEPCHKCGEPCFVEINGIAHAGEAGYKIWCYTCAPTSVVRGYELGDISPGLHTRKVTKVKIAYGDGSTDELVMEEEWDPK